MDFINVLAALISLIALICFFVMCSNIAKIRHEIEELNSHFKKTSGTEKVDDGPDLY